MRGTAIAVYRLHKALMYNNIDSAMLVMHKSRNEQNIYSVQKGTLKNALFKRLRNKIK